MCIFYNTQYEKIENWSRLLFTFWQLWLSNWIYPFILVWSFGTSGSLTSIIWLHSIPNYQLQKHILGKLRSTDTATSLPAPPTKAPAPPTPSEKKSLWLNFFFWFPLSFLELSFCYLYGHHFVIKQSLKGAEKVNIKEEN